MHLPVLLSRLTRPRGLVWRLFSATGFGATAPCSALAAAVVAVGRDGVLTHLGPVTFQPAVPVLLLAPMLLGIACGIAHSTWDAPVVRRVPRVLAMRAASYLASLAISGALLVVGSLTRAADQPDLTGGLARNLLLLAGLCLLVGALAGIALAWLPAVLVVGAALLSGSSSNPWAPSTLLFAPQATTGQLLVAAAVCATGLLVAVADPVSRGYLTAR